MVSFSVEFQSDIVIMQEEFLRAEFCKVLLVKYSNGWAVYYCSLMH